MTGRWPRTALAMVMGACLTPCVSAAQGGTASLKGMVFDSTAMEPLGGARVAVLGTSAITDADPSGHFELSEIPEGSFWVSFFHPRLQSLGVSAPSRQIKFEAGKTTTIELAVPSERTLLMGWCMAEQGGSGYAAVAGTVTDSLTGVPLARALVTATPAQRRPGDSPALEARADESGYYRMCNIPANRDIRLQAHFGQSSGRTKMITVGEGDASVQDLILMMSAEAVLVGRVVDYVTGGPVQGASITVLGTDSHVISDSDGTFALTDLPPGRHLVVTEHLGYAQRTDSVTVFSQETVNIEVRMATEALEVEGLVVTARSRFGRTSLAGEAKRADFITRAEIEPMLSRVESAGDLLRNMNTPGIRVREVMFADPVTGIQVPGFCVESSRRGARSSGGCAQVAVYVNDVLMPSGGEFLRDLDPNIIERIEILSPMDAQFQFGAQAANGVVAIYTR